MTPLIGHSNGWLCAVVGPELSATTELLAASGASVCEFVVDRELRLNELAMPNLPEVRLECASLHLPDLSNFDGMGVDERRRLGEKLRTICDRFWIDTGALHPDLASAATVKWLTELGVPFGIENMDRLKKSYRSAPEVLAALDAWGVPLVLDVQHAYEISRDSGGNGVDLSIELARGAQRRSGITHLHVSGEITRAGKQSENHSSLVWATNTVQILEAVREVVRTVPGPVKIILEGNYLPTDSPGTGIDSAEPSRREEFIQLAAKNMRRERDLLMERLIESRS